MHLMDHQPNKSFLLVRQDDLPLTKLSNMLVYGSTEAFYLPPINPEKKSAIMGLGDRSSLADKNQGKYPHGYSLPSSISVNKGNSLKAGRYVLSSYDVG